MTTKVGPAKPPKGPRRGSLTSIHYNDEAVEVEGVGSTPMVSNFLFENHFGKINISPIHGQWWPD